ncbi:bile acid:sodium symporter family protein [Lipingzhangella sp. LS1_29]|uniref:Bile acid:sodium symporter family protein n=1 Tax=Lipingzhangella rawalii TaxID=2055835 RepID=A0ABU2H112_9ACTN|nr:bile acid:sodium symporter family protein [Lipingzhangella rawalii]MDS1268994.1 bile acid:sodium symporter family protein [Lipingzhangella rawalii]
MATAQQNTWVGRWFALFVVAGAAIGLVTGDEAARLAPHIPLLLGIIMFGMGLTLRPVDFRTVLRHPGAVALGLTTQFLVMPLVAWGVGTGLGLAPPLLVGMILVGAAPGGTASNVIVYMSRGDVALSVSMTTVSTLLAPLVTPLLVVWLAGSTLEVAATALFTDIVQIVLLPVLGGLVVRTLLPRLVERALPLLPVVSALGIMVVVAAIFGANADEVLTTGGLLALAVVAHNTLGLLLGYGAAWASRLPEETRRAVSIEVGMQNSGLATALATAHFAPLAALPGALFSVWHNLSGAVLATVWARQPTGQIPPDARCSRPPE